METISFYPDEIGEISFEGFLVDGETEAQIDLFENGLMLGLKEKEMRARTNMKLQTRMETLLNHRLLKLENSIERNLEKLL